MSSTTGWQRGSEGVYVETRTWLCPCWHGGVFDRCMVHIGGDDGGGVSTVQSGVCADNIFDGVVCRAGRDGRGDDGGCGYLCVGVQRLDEG